MPYPNEHEYIEAERNKIENTLRDYFLGDIDVIWYKKNAKNNYANKVDTRILVFTDFIEKIDFQIKSSGYVNRFTVGKDTLDAYLNNNYNLDFLMVTFFKDKHLYLFPSHDP